LIFDVALLGCGLDSHRFVALLPAKKWDSSSLKSIRIDFEFHPESDSMGNVGCYRRRMVQSCRGLQMTTPLHLVPRLGISGAIFRYIPYALYHPSIISCKIHTDLLETISVTVHERHMYDIWVRHMNYHVRV
jgi:hypothetical protein